MNAVTSCARVKVHPRRPLRAVARTSAGGGSLALTDARAVSAYGIVRVAVVLPPHDHPSRSGKRTPASQQLVAALGQPIDHESILVISGAVVRITATNIRKKSPTVTMTHVSLYIASSYTVSAFCHIITRSLLINVPFIIIL